MKSMKSVDLPKDLSGNPCGFIHKKCGSQMKKNLRYHLDVIIESNLCKYPNTTDHELCNTIWSLLCWQSRYNRGDEDGKLRSSNKSNKSIDLWNPWNLRIYPRIYKWIWGFNPKCKDFMMNWMNRTENKRGNRSDSDTDRSVFRFVFWEIQLSETQLHLRSQFNNGTEIV